uniref:ATP synthase CF0 subunit I n=1 Tax=Nitzschia sp. (in: diatoms) TaxID=1884248 RepID=A0A5J6DUT1_9STRA|nr:ATP synthase CF0 subunit I [Nitzschia sp. (in: diatoms)]
MLSINFLIIYHTILELGIINNLFFCLLLIYLIKTFFFIFLKQRKLTIIKSIKKSELYYIKIIFLFNKLKNTFSQTNILFIKLKKKIFDIRKIFIKNRIIIIKFSLNFYLLKIIQLFKLKKIKFVFNITNKINYLILKDLNNRIK